MRHILASILRKNPIGTAVLDAFPQRVRLYDGRSATVPRKVARLFRLWNSEPGSRAESTQAFAAYSGGDFLDIGAYHGWYSWLLAPRAREDDTFVSIEVDISVQPTLLHNLAALSAQFPALRIHSLLSAAGDGGTAEVSHPLGRGMHPRVTSGAASGPGTSTLAIDSLVPLLSLRPSFVKVDVEGAEFHVLRGMKETLREFRPQVMLELHPLFQPAGINLDDATSVLRDLGYKSTDLGQSPAAIRQLWR